MIQSKSENNHVLVSVIVPTFNNEKTIESCVNSLKNQDYNNFEIVIVDDESNDETYKIASELSENNNIRIYKIKHSGVSAARNYGLKHSNGEYIMFCDADDTVCQNWISKMIHNECDYSLCSYHDKRLCKNDWTKSYDECIAWILKNYIYICRSVCTKCFRADIIKKANVQFDEDLYCYEDGLFILEYLLNLESNSSINYVNEKLYNYNVIESGAHNFVNKEQEALYYNKMLAKTKHAIISQDLKPLFERYIESSYLYYRMTRLVRENKEREVKKLIKQNRKYLNFGNLKYVSRLRERLFVLIGSGKLYCWAYRKFGKQ